MPMAFAETRESINEWWNMLRAVCVGVDAQCVITVAEAWLSYDTSVRPSVSASRREVVAVSAAWRAADTGLIEQRMSYREVARAPDGSVTGLSDEVSGGGDADTPMGEILGIRASRTERKAAKALIRHMEKSGGLELIPPPTRH